VKLVGLSREERMRKGVRGNVVGKREKAYCSIGELKDKH